MTLYQVELSASAKEDIEDIALYTFEQYGLNKQMTYIRLIEMGLNTIAQNPYIGHAHSELSDDIQIWRTGKHIIIYTVDDDKSVIYVVRILHQSTDVKRHI